MNKHLRRLMPLGVASLLAVTPNSGAALLFYEGFNYGAATGSLTAASGWETSSSNDDSVYESGGLSYGNLQVSGGAARTVTTWGNGTRTVTLDIPDIDLTAKTEVWISMLVQTPGSVSNNSSATFGVQMQRNSWGSFQNYTFGKGYNDQTTNHSSFLGAVPGAEYATLDGDPFLVVYRFEVGSPGEVWINPALGGGAPVAGSGTALTDSGNLTAISSLVLSYRGHDKIFDELRVGDTFADVTPVPEPGAAGLLGLGLAFSLCVRRRRR